MFLSYLDVFGVMVISCFLWMGAWDLDVEGKSELSEEAKVAEESKKTE